ncbi:RICIN domain-containing protein [Streptomyces termitum]|uniref:RICIN domain-containing protein n=1 Tax=Streptomyces termitum TaxID=67368 RepID=UPI0033B7B4F8
MGGDMRLSVQELRFPVITFGVEGVSFPVGRKRRNAPAGPFLLIARDCGLALDTALGTRAGDKPHLWPPHADRHQLWFLLPGGAPGETLIVSAANGLALDSGADSGQPELVMWQPHREPWQRWRLQQSPDGAAFSVEAVHSRRFLTADDRSERGWRPWFEDHHAKWSQQWILSLPHGGNPVP